MNEIWITAVVKRINRKLKGKNIVLKKARGARAQAELGEYFLLDVRRNMVKVKNVDVEMAAMKLDVLGEHEIFSSV